MLIFFIMIDAHVHLDKGPLTKKYLDEFIKEAIKNNIDEIHVLNHSHRFKEFKPLYKNCFGVLRQAAWLKYSLRDSIYDYINFIKEMKKEKFPIKVLFGLEVCYFEDKEDFLREILSIYDFDFLIGSIHYIDNIGYDVPWSKDALWSKYDADYIYKKYFNSYESLIKSDLFTQIGHPDTIKIYGIYPSYDLKDTYQRIAKLAHDHNVIVENNTKVHYEYKQKDIGLKQEFLDILKNNKCKLIASSDAHSPKEVGLFLEEAYKRINE